MKNEKLLDAIGKIDDALIDEAVKDKKQRKQHRWLQWGAIAACICVFITAGVVLRQSGKPLLPSADEDLVTDVIDCETGDMPSDESVSSSADKEPDTAGGVTIPPASVTLSLPEGAEADMMAFFIYQGRCYMEYEWIETPVDFVGEYLGTSVGMIDEWTPEEGYVELAGSISGDFYSVEGYAPSFMLCMKGADDGALLFINNNGITLNNGADLFEERLHLSEKYSSLSFISQEALNAGGEPVLLEDSDAEVVSAFIDAVNQATVIQTEDIPLEDGQYLYDKQIGQIYFTMDNGITVIARLYEGGYVGVRGFMDVCVQIENDVFDAMVEVLVLGDVME